MSVADTEHERTDAPRAVPRGQAGSLKPVLAVIPAAAYDNPTWRGLLYLARDAAVYLAAVVGIVVVDNPVAKPFLWLLAGLSTFSLLVVAHDMGHGAMFRSRRLNATLGRIAFLPSLTAYSSWDVGHNRVHHVHTIRQERDFVWAPHSPEQYLALSRWRRLQHRVEWSWAGPGLYYLRIPWATIYTTRSSPRRARAVRRDRMLVAVWAAAMVGGCVALGSAGSGGALGGLWLAFQVVAIPFLICCTVMGWVVKVQHIAPGIPWYGDDGWTKVRAQLEGTTIFRLPRGLDFFFHWILHHVPHHVDMRIPMYRLPLASDALTAAFPEVVRNERYTVGTWFDLTRRCKLFDPPTQLWLTYGEASALVEARSPSS